MLINDILLDIYVTSFNILLSLLTLKNLNTLIFFF